MANSSIAELRNGVDPEVYGDLEAQFTARADAFIAVAREAAAAS